MYLYCYMYICSITRNCNSLRNKISIYLSIYLEIKSCIYHCKRKTLPLSVSHFIAVLKHKLGIYTYKYTDVTDDSLPCGLKLIKYIVTL